MAKFGYNYSMDRRIARTKKSIKQAFAYLLSQKDLNEITITDIANAADINRKTFYTYYAGIYEVIDDIEDEIADIFEEATQNLQMRDFLENPHTVIHHLDLIVNQDLEYYGNLLRMKGNSSLNTKIVKVLKTKIETEFMKEYPDKDPEKVSVITDFLFSGVVETFRLWFTAERKIPLKELSDIIEKLTVTGLKGFLK